MCCVSRTHGSRNNYYIVLPRLHTFALLIQLSTNYLHSYHKSVGENRGGGNASLFSLSPLELITWHAVVYTLPQLMLLRPPTFDKAVYFRPHS